MSETDGLVLDHLLEYRTRLLERLERQPREVAAVLAAIPEREWQKRRSPDGRSVHMLAAHVRDLERLAFFPRLSRILHEERPTLEPFQSHDWTDRDYRPEEPLTDILAAWSQTRTEVLDDLPPPSSPAWNRTGFHPPSGQRTLQWWAERIFSHAQQHLLEMRAARLR